MAADVVGYSRLVEHDEAGTLSAVRARRREILDPLVARHRGRIFKISGDGVLVEFGSAVNALRCAVELQQGMATANHDLPQERRMLLRIGVNLGDVTVEGGDLYGEGIILAVRLQAMAGPGEILLSAGVQEQVAGRLEVEFEDLGLREIKNSAKRARVFRARTEGDAAAGAATAPAGQSAPSIIVLPFENMSGDPAQQYLSDGITEDIITELARFRSLSVAARHVSMDHAGKGAGLLQLARELGTAYFLEGSVRKSGERLRITAQLIDARTGNHIWAERYDRESRDIFAVQDEVVSAIVTTLEGRLVATAAELARAKPTTSWSAYDCLLQGRELCNDHSENAAVPYFARATEIDPNFAQAHAWLALALVVSCKNDVQPQNLSRAAQAAQRALALDANDATVHWASGMTLLYLREHERSGVHFDRAVALNPADLQIRADRAAWLRFCGRLGEALAAIDEALKSGPLSPQWFWTLRGETLFDLKRYREAIEAFNKVTQKRHLSYCYLASAHSHLGDAAGAAQALAKAKEMWPELSTAGVAAIMPHIDDRSIDHLFEGLRRAGLE